MPPLQGSFSEYVKAPIHQVAKAPIMGGGGGGTTLSMEEMASLPLVGLTAWQALQPHIVPNQSNVLILGGSGGTGHIAIQLAKALGAKSVTTICSTCNVEFVKECGATYVIDYSTEEDIIVALQTHAMEHQGCPFDVILDCVTSGDPVDAEYRYPHRIRRATNPSIVTSDHLYQRLGGPWTDWVRAGLARSGIFPQSWLWKDPQERLFWIQFPHSSKALEELTKLVEHGQLKPHLQKQYPTLTANTVNQAFHDILSRRVQGKIAIRVASEDDDDEDDNDKVEDDDDHGKNN
jgi:NADPH:quinone reductase-like Zn-dependent oxidoreductase